MVSSIHEFFGLPCLLLFAYLGSAVPGRSVTCLISCSGGARMISPNSAAALSCIISETRTILVCLGGFFLKGAFGGIALTLSFAFCSTRAFALALLMYAVLIPRSCLSPLRWKVSSLAISVSGIARLSTAYTILAMISASSLNRQSTCFPEFG